MNHENNYSFGFKRLWEFKKPSYVVVSFTCDLQIFLLVFITEFEYSALYGDRIIDKAL